MASLSFTPQQKNAIYSESGNLLVSAAAGSGKTAVLTERVINKLTGENPIDADKLIVVTFTVASAIEMKQRIEKKMHNLIANSPENHLLQNQSILLTNAKISTIHSLCNELVKENFQVLGLPVNYRLAEENEIKIMKAQILEEIIEDFYNADDEDFLNLADFCTVKDDAKISEIVMGIYDFIRPFPFSISFMKSFLAPYNHDVDFLQTHWGKLVSPYIESNLNNAKSLLDAIYSDIYSDDAISSKYAPAYENDFDTIKILLKYFSQNDWDKCCEVMSNYEKKRLNGVRGFPDTDLLDKIKSNRTGACDILIKLRDKFFCITNEDFKSDLKLLSPIIAKFFDIVEKFDDTLQSEKLQKSIIDFSDLEHYTLKLLIKHEDNKYIKTDLARHISEQYEEIMIDECQDINTVQNLIFWGLSKSSNEIECDFSKILVDSKNLFLVGDVKQSIYRFRNAMPQLFTERSALSNAFTPENYTRGDTAKIVLQNNFRSNHHVTDFVNFLFSSIMTPALGEIDYNQDEFLIPLKSSGESDDFSPEIHLLDLPKQDPSIPKNKRLDAVKLEGDYIAGMIEKMVSEGYLIHDNGALRKCKYSDFCILLRSKKDKSTKYLQALKERNINCFSDASNGYFNSFEISVMLDLLRIIDNPLLDIPLFSVMLSPMFMFTPDEIAKIRLLDKKSSLYTAVTLSANLEKCPKCIAFLNAIDYLRQQSLIISTHKLIQKIYDETGFMYVVESMTSGEEKKANLRLLLTYAQSYEKIGYKGVSGFISFVDKAIERNEDFSCANVLPQKSNAVKIMSIHGSKGLEFPICIVADMAKNANLMDLYKTFLLNSQHGIGLKIFEHDKLKAYSNLPLEAIRYATRNELLSEEMRTLYVALTRPKEKLILVASMTDAKKSVDKITHNIINSTQEFHFSLMEYTSYIDWVICAYARQKKLDRNFDISDKFIICSDFDETQKHEEEFKLSGEVDEELYSNLQNRFEHKYKFEPLSTIPAKITVTQIAKSQQNIDFVDLNPISLTDESIVTGAKRGTILHSFMQYADFKNAQINLDGEILRLVNHSFISHDDAQLLNRAKISAFLRSKLFERMINSKSLFREYQFIYELNAAEIHPYLPQEFAEQTVVLQGIADTVFVEENGVVIVDYKTDRINDEQELAKKYETQLLIYKQALSNHFDLPINECYIYSLHLEKEIKIDV